MVSKKALKEIIVPILVGTLMVSLLPLSVGAQGEDQERPERNPAARFCENLAEAEAKALSRLEERKGKTDRSADIEAKKAERLAELDAHRAERDAARQEHYDALRERATTDEQAAAVDEFEETVEALVADRKAAADEAIEAFESDVEALLAERDEAVDGYAEAIEADIMAIFADAEAACDDDTPGVEVREQLKADLMAMREGIKADREQYSFKDDLKAARDARKASFESAREGFKTALEAAKDELRAAFEG